MPDDLAKIPAEFVDDVRRAVKILKDGGCREVYVFGSLAEGRAREGSDVDLAVRGCPPAHFFSVYGRLMMELKHEIDLVDLDSDCALTRFLKRRGPLLHVG